MSRWRRLDPLAPFAGVVAVYLLYRQIYDWTKIGLIDPPVPSAAWRSSLEAPAAVADLGGRLVWGIATLALVLAFAATLWVCVAAIFRSTAGRLRTTMLIAALGTAGLGVAAGLADNPLTLPRVAETLDQAYDRIGLVDGSFLLRLSNGLGMAAAMLLTFAASSTLFGGGGRTGGDRTGRTEELRSRTLTLRRVLITGAAVLIAGSATGAAMHRLPVPYLESPWSGAFETLAQWTAVAAGSLWTLFLIGIYLPTAAILRHRLDAEAFHALPEADEASRREWIAEHGFDLSPSQQLKRLVVALGPLLSSLPLAAFFEILGG